MAEKQAQPIFQGKKITFVSATAAAAGLGLLAFFRGNLFKSLAESPLTQERLSKALYAQVVYRARKGKTTLANIKPESLRAEFQNKGFQEFELQTPSVNPDDGSTHKLKIWYIPAKPGKKTVLYAHGNGGNLLSDSNLRNMKAWTDLGLGYLAFDWSGYGESEGKPSEAQLIADLDTVKSYLNQTIDDSQVIVYGRSLGSGIVIDMAQNNTRIAGIILSSAYTDMPSVIEYSRTGQIIQQKILNLKDPALRERLRTMLFRDRFDSLSKIPNIHVPMLLVHGTQDGVVPYEMSEQLMAKAGTKNIRLYTIQGATHHLGEYTNAIRDMFMNDVLKETP